jgi:hypothetical protein
MRRHGASHASKRARADVPTKTFPNARRKLNEILKAFCFVKVSEVTHKPAQNGRPEFFHGLSSTQSNSRFETASERVFFDKGGRLRYSATFDIGPCKLVDAAWGRDHPSALPQIGDILVGVLEVNTGGNTKSRISKVLRSWSRHGKIIMELSRMVEFGTSLSEFDARSILRQNECAMVEQARLASNMGANVSSSGSSASSADDFWMLARLILWGNVRPLVVLHSIQTGCKCKIEPTSAELVASSELKLSCSAYDFLSGLAFKLEDSELMKDFTDSLEIFQPIILPPMPPPPVPYHLGYGVYSHSANPAPAAQLPVSQNYAQGNVTPPYAPSSPTYVPSSPTYAPSSPTYIPSSPQHLQVQAPSSPAYLAHKSAPSSPVYRPSSPPKNDSFIVSYRDI